MPKSRELVIKQFPLFEHGSDGAFASKEHLVLDSLSPTEKTKEEITASQGAETSKDSFHSQNDDHEEYVIQLTVKQQLFACHSSQSPKRPCAMSGEVVETTNAQHLGNTIHNDMQENNASTYDSDNSLVSSIECQKINVNRFTMPSSSMMYNKDKFQ